MIKGLKRLNIKTSPARIRKMINIIRNYGIIKQLISTSKGYYIAKTSKEVEEYVESLRQRARSIDELANSLEKQITYGD